MDTSLFYTFLCFFIVILAFKLLKRGSRKLPPSPAIAIPLIGHFYLLKPPLHRTFSKLSQKLGPILSVRLGSRHVVVVSSPALVDECFTKNDVVLANRPRFILAKYVSYDFTSLILAPYGDHWRNLRRLTTIEVFSSARLNTFTSIRQDEIKLLLEKLYRKSRHEFTKVQLRDILSHMTFNNIMRMVAGKRYFGVDEDNEEAKRFQMLITKAFKAGGAFNPVDFFPLLKWVGFKGIEKKLARLQKEMDLFLQNLIDEHRQRKGTSTMINHLLSLQESEPEYYSDTIIKGIIMVMLLGGTDTSSVTIEWAMSALLNHPEKLEKARTEVEKFVGHNRLVNESDIPHLSYLQNIISETLRLFPAAPLLVPHESSCDCKVGGYDIPEGTIVIVNAWSIHRDPMIWDDPTSFKPERFETGENGPPKLMPFGMGRRSCPGSGLAQRVVSLTLASLIQCFDWKRIDDADIDMKEGVGSSMPKAIPLEAKCKARDVLHKVFS